MICYVLAMGKQHLGPHVVVGYGIKMFWSGLFITSPNHLAKTWNCSIFYRISSQYFKVRSFPCLSRRSSSSHSLAARAILRTWKTSWCFVSSQIALACCSCKFWGLQKHLEWCSVISQIAFEKHQSCPDIKRNKQESCNFLKVAPGARFSKLPVT